MVDIHALGVAASAMRSMSGRPATVTNRRSRCSTAILGALLICTLAGCTDSERVSSQASPNTAVANVEDAHTHVDVLFARDIIDHSAQAIALSNLIIGKAGVAPQVVGIARQITASSTIRINELQTLLLEWGFTPTTVGSAPPVATAGAPIQPDEHPLASDTDFGLLRDALGSRATGVFLELITRQHQFAISAARDQLQSGLHPGAMAIARLLIETEQSEIYTMEGLKR